MNTTPPPSPAVHLYRVPSYEDPGLGSAVEDILANILPAHPAKKVLVKPNLLKAGNHGLICTHPSIVRTVCAHLRDLGCEVVVGDSPGFGSAVSVSRRIGLLDALSDLDVPVLSLDKPVQVPLPFGHTVGVSRRALEADLIVNLPKLKAHCQMRMTGAVKNLFGCVSGVRKAVAHTLHGDKGNRFPSLILELGQVLPPSVHLLDGITAMHVDGPHGGQPYPLGMLGGSTSAVALDTAACTVIGLTPDRVPIWREALGRSMPGAVLEAIRFPALAPGDFPAPGFVTPETLMDETFNPFRLLKSSIRRGLARLKR